MQVRLLELQNESDALQACAVAGRSVAGSNLRGWAALLPAEGPAAALREAGLAVLRGERHLLALGSLSSLWSAARSLAASLGEHRELAAVLRDRVAAVEEGPAPWALPRTALARGRTLVMGVVNVTPDSFSDGGRFLDAGPAIEHGLQLAAEGADILDVGGESTNPFGARPVEAAEERRRVEPVLRGLARQARTPLCIDTTKASVAQAALDLGAEIVNDVSGLARDPSMGNVVARARAAVCLMHMRGVPQDMQARATYVDLHGEVLAELEEALRRARAAGIPDERCAIDPGLGFAKTASHSLLLLRRLRELTQLRLPVVVGASRKSFIGRATGRDPKDRLFGSIAAAAVAAVNGAAVVRVHDVAATQEAVRVADAVRTSTA